MHSLRDDLEGEPLVVAVYCNLPAISNPLTGLMQEALVQEYNLSEAQIKELKRKAQNGEILLMILCDAGSPYRPCAPVIIIVIIVATRTPHLALGTLYC